MKQISKRQRFNWLSLTLILIVICMVSYGIPIKIANASSYNLSNPRIDNDGVATWDCVYFGNYWQNDTNGDGVADKKDAKQPIKWRVLSVNGKDAFLLADQNLDCQPYNEECTDVTWETCTLRQWLNQDFYQNAFDSSEQSAIQKTVVVNSDNPYRGTEGGNDTSDKVYLLSIGEACNSAYGFYHTNDEGLKTRQAKNTSYAKECGAYNDTDEGSVDNGWWWLRSPGSMSINAASVEPGGYDDNFGNVNIYDFAVRPSLHLDLSADVWSKAGTVCSLGVGNGDGIVTATANPEEGEYTTPSPKPTVASDIKEGGMLFPVAENKIGNSSLREIGNKAAEKAPAKVTIKSCHNKKDKMISLSWKKVKGIKGYQIQYATTKKFNKKKSRMTKKTKYNLTKLKRKKTYYIRICAYKLDCGKKIYGKWSKVRKVKVKK